MVARTSLGLIGLTFLALGTGCVAAPPPEQSAAEAREAIINGTKDTTHTAVVALLGQNSECTGTVFSVDVNNKVAYILSAGHCVNEPGSPADPPQEARLGADYNNPQTVYPVTNWVAHPSWPQNDNYDYSIITISWANKPQPPSIPLITAAQDNLGPGSTVDFVGYGVTSISGAGQFNSLRYHVQGELDQVTSSYVHYNQSNSGQYANGAGPCSGDSGGPALYTVAGVGEVVAAVTSRGDQNCNQEGFSSRVSNVLDWINTCINGGDCAMGGGVTCDQCAGTETDTGGACASVWNACLNNNACLAFVECLQPCQTQACVDQCAQDNPNGIDGYAATLECLCTTGCVTECADAGFCQGGQPSCGFQSPDTTCQTCLENSCCAQGSTCAADPVCTDCFTNPDADPSCVNTNGPANAFATCLTDNCSVQCGFGGSGGTGGSGAGGGGVGGAGATGGAGTGGANTGAGGPGGDASNGGGGSDGGSGGNKDDGNLLANCACRTGAGSTSPGSDGLAAMLGAALLGVFASRRRRDRV